MMILIYGPTGSGKTDFSLALSKHLPVEIINMDIGSFYAPVTIGTAKPDWRSNPVPHHLFDTIIEPKNYTVTQYKEDVVKLCEEIKSRGKVPLLVGGSGFYLKSLFFPVQAPAQDENHEYSEPTEQLWQMLHAIDPQRALAINKNDRYRITRALNIWKSSGTLPSAQAPLFKPIDSAFIIHVTRDRQDVYHRINQRVLAMFKQGWIDEVRSLSPEWKSFLVQKKLIGYDDIISFLQDSSAQESQLITQIQTKSRNYAKRQETFWRMFEKQLLATGQLQELIAIETINLTLMDLDLYIKQLLPRIKLFQKGSHV